MFKGSNDFEFTKFSFKTNYNNTVVYSVHSNYSFSRGKQEKKKALKLWLNILWVISTVNNSLFNLLIFRQNSMIFEGSPNSLTESHFNGELRLGGPNSQVN